MDHRCYIQPRCELPSGKLWPATLPAATGPTGPTGPGSTGPGPTGPTGPGSAMLTGPTGSTGSSGIANNLLYWAWLESFSSQTINQLDGTAGSPVTVDFFYPRNNDIGWSFADNAIQFVNKGYYIVQYQLNLTTTTANSPGQFYFGFYRISDGAPTAQWTSTFPISSSNRSDCVSGFAYLQCKSDNTLYQPRAWVSAGAGPVTLSSISQAATPPSGARGYVHSVRFYITLALNSDNFPYQPGG